jgi:Small subunit of serine palmitoyltransferase-like
MSTTAITSDAAPFFTPTTLTLIVLSLVLIPAMFVTPAPFLQWLQRKRYQYEVTFSLYMLTPTEKFIFSVFPHLIPSHSFARQA